jgi:hypothetical protein
MTRFSRGLVLPAVTVSVAVLAAAAPAAAGTAGIVSPAPHGPAAAARQLSAGTQLWARRYNGPGNGFDKAYAVAVSPNGRIAFVTGQSGGRRSTHTDFATVAYSVTTGKQLWLSRYNGPANGFDGAYALAVSPKGNAVFVTGISQGRTSSEDYATVAYAAATGKRLWVRRYNGPGNRNDTPAAIAVSPDGARVFVTGQSGRKSGSLGYDWATVGYSAATGKQLWVRRYSGSSAGFQTAVGLVVGPGGTKVFVTGYVQDGTTRSDYGTVAYSASTGRQLWASRYNGPANNDDTAVAIAMSRRGTAVFVTGRSWGGLSGNDYATVAYSAATGAQLWARRYNGPGNGDDDVSSVTVSPDGARVFVTGSSPGGSTGGDYATVAYDAATGAQLWARRYNGPANGGDAASAAAVSPSGTMVFVTGASAGTAGSADYATVAYSAATGRQLWARRYNGQGIGAAATSLAVSPGGFAVVVTGQSFGPKSGSDYATVAYRA